MFDMPFVAFYRKEYVEPELNIHDLNKVYHLAEKVSVLLFRSAIFSKSYPIHTLPTMSHYRNSFSKAILRCGNFKTQEFSEPGKCLVTITYDIDGQWRGKFVLPVGHV